MYDARCFVSHLSLEEGFGDVEGGRKGGCCQRFKPLEVLDLRVERVVYGIMELKRRGFGL